MKVFLSIFSGRPDPSWDIAPELAGEVGSRVTNLPDAPSGPREKLGYRGFYFLPLAGRFRGDVAEVRVFDGVISIEHDDGRIEHKIDARGLEAWLVQEARRQGFGDLIDAMA